MVTLTELWLPILLSGALVWIVSALVWMVLPHHKSDFAGLPDEEAARQALQPQNLEPGIYNIPHMPSRDSARKPEQRKKFTDGPVAFVTVLPNEDPAMAGQMLASFAYFVIAGIAVAYVSGRVLAPGAEYLQVFRVAGTVAWLTYGWGRVLESVWFGLPWSQQVKHLFDALLYALATAATFAWLWPPAIAG